MKLKDFEKIVKSMGFELLSVTLSTRQGSTVIKALAVERLSKKKCYAYVWYHGCCRKSFKILSYADVRANVSSYNAEGPLNWLPFPTLNMSVLEQKCLARSGNA